MCPLLFGRQIQEDIFKGDFIRLNFQKSDIFPNDRPGDILARYGGEEFILVLPGAEEEAARRTAERLRELVDDPRHIIPGHDPLVMRWYRAPDKELEGIAVRLDAEPEK